MKNAFCLTQIYFCCIFTWEFQMQYYCFWSINGIYAIIIWFQRQQCSNYSDADAKASICSWRPAGTTLFSSHLYWLKNCCRLLEITFNRIVSLLIYSSCLYVVHAIGPLALIELLILRAQAEGIFRINAENGQEENVRDQLNSGVVPEDIDVHCLAGLIKVLTFHNFCVNCIFLHSYNLYIYLQSLWCTYETCIIWLFDL